MNPTIAACALGLIDAARDRHAIARIRAKNHLGRMVLTLTVPKKSRRAQLARDLKALAVPFRANDGSLTVTFFGP